MTVDAPRAQEALAGLVGAERVWPATAADAIEGRQPTLVVEPASVEAAAKAFAYADQQGLAVAPRGGGTRLDWGRPPQRLDLVLSTLGLNQILEHAAGDMTATVQAGVTLAALRERLATEGQRLALDLPWAERATIGGLLATDDSGSLRLRYGGLRDLIIGITVVRPDGVVARAGGKVVKNVAGFDLAKLFTGSLGTLGLIVEATFRLHPLPDASATLALRAETPEAAGAFVSDVLGSTLVPTGLTVAWPDDGAATILLRFEGLAAAIEQQAAEAERLARARGIAVSRTEPAEAAAAWQGMAELPWEGGAEALVGRVGLLPAEIGPTLRVMEAVARDQRVSAVGVLHAHGLGLVQAEAVDQSAGRLADFARHLRERLVTRHGTLSLLRAPAEVKRNLDAWGLPAETLPLLEAVRQRFDPHDTLNPGRLIPTRTQPA